MSTGLSANKPKPATAEQQLSSWLRSEDTLARINSVLGGVMDAEAYIASVLLSLNDPKLAKCSVMSKYDVAFKCSTMGFIPQLNHVAIVPRNNKKIVDGKETWVTEATMVPQWQGYKAVMERHPEILEVDAVIVFDHEDLSFNSSTGQVDHKYNPLDPRRVVDSKPSMENILGGYVKISYRDRSRPPKFHFVTANHIRKSRARAETDKVWTEWTDPMVLKSLYRDTYARRAVPIDPIHAKQMESIIEQEDAELGNAVLLDAAPKIEDRPVSRAQAMLGGIAKQPEIQVADFQEPEVASEPPPKKADPEPQASIDHYALLRPALEKCVTMEDLEEVMARLPDFLDEISTPICKGADELANARKKAILKEAK